VVVEVSLIYDKIAIIHSGHSNISIFPHLAGMHYPGLS
jgi:hypothetical protein